MKKSLLFGTLLIISGYLNAGNYALGTHGEIGDPSDPIPLADVADLIKLSETDADYGLAFVLTADIDMAGQTFNSIGYTVDGSTVGFTGSIDGQSHIIKDLTVTLRTGQTDLGFIGYGDDCTIENLGFTNMTIDPGATGGSVTGGVGMIGYLEGNNSLVSNCFTTGYMSARNGLGGIVGRLSGKSTISNCMSAAILNAYYDTRTGGIVGIVHNYVDNAADAVTNCTFYGELQKRGAKAALSGGTVGQVDTDLADVTVASNCYFKASSGGITQPKNSNLSNIGTALTVSDLRIQGSYTSLDFPVTWKMLANGVAVLSTFDNSAFECAITPSVDGTGAGTISPSTPQTVVLGESLTFTFTTSHEVTAVTLYGQVQTIGANPASFTIDGVINTSDLVVTFDNATDINDDLIQNQLSVYPNPSNGIFNIDGDAAAFEVYNMVGVMVYASEKAGQQEFNLEGFENGVYFLRLKDENGNSQVIKLLKE